MEIINADWNIFQTEIEKNLINSALPKENTVNENIEQFSKLIYDTLSNIFSNIATLENDPLSLGGIKILNTL